MDMWTCRCLNLAKVVKTYTKNHARSHLHDHHRIWNHDHARSWGRILHKSYLWSCMIMHDHHIRSHKITAKIPQELRVICVITTPDHTPDHTRSRPRSCKNPTSNVVLLITQDLCTCDHTWSLDTYPRSRCGIDLGTRILFSNYTNSLKMWSCLYWSCVITKQDSCA